MAEYVLESRTKNGTYLATLPFRDLQSEFYYSKTRALRWTMSLTSLNRFTTDDLYPAKTEVKLIRNGIPIFVGPLWDMNISKNENRCTFVAEDLSSYFSRRRAFSTDEMSGTFGDISWNLINGSQSLTNGNLFITRGTAVPGGAPSGTFIPTKGQYIDDILTTLSTGDNGFDWVFSADRTYNQYYPKIQSRANVRLEYGGNVSSYSINIMGKYLGNDIITVGRNKTFSSVVTDTTSQSIYGLMQHVDEFTSTEDLVLINDYNAGVLALRVAPKDVPQLVLKSDIVNPLDGDISYGQVTRTVINDGFSQYDKDMRCTGFQLSLGKHGNEKFNLYLNDMREVA